MKLKDARRIADTKFPVFQVLKKQMFTVVLKNCKTQAAKHSMEKTFYLILRIYQQC